MYQEKLSSYLREFFIVLAICNTVVVSTPQPSSPSKKLFEENNEFFDKTPEPCRNQDESPISNTLHADICDGASNQTNGQVNKGLVPSPGKPINQNENGLCVPSAFNVEQCSSSNDVSYEAESPDEAALVKMANSYGYKLISRSPHTVTVLIPDQGLITYDVLHVLPFDSSRKRMSVVIRTPDGDVIMYCKGADSAVIERLSRDHRTHGDQTDGSASRRVSITDKTEVHLDVYARDGLRTLCMARKVI